MMLTLPHFLRPTEHKGREPTGGTHVARAGDNDYAESAQHLAFEPLAHPLSLLHPPPPPPPPAPVACDMPAQLATPPDGHAAAEERSFLEILAPRTVVFRGIGQDVDAAVLSGTLVLHLAESMDLRDITLEFTGTRRRALARTVTAANGVFASRAGKAKLPAPPSPCVPRLSCLVAAAR